MVTSAMRFTLKSFDDILREYPLPALVDVKVLRGELKISDCFVACAQFTFALTMCSGHTALLPADRRIKFA